MMSLWAENMPELKCSLNSSISCLYIYIHLHLLLRPREVTGVATSIRYKYSGQPGVRSARWMVHDWLWRKVNTLCCGFQVNQTISTSFIHVLSALKSLLSRLVNETSAASRAVHNLFSLKFFSVVIKKILFFVNLTYKIFNIKIWLQKYLSCNYQENCELYRAGLNYRVMDRLGLFPCSTGWKYHGLKAPIKILSWKIPEILTRRRTVGRDGSRKLRDRFERK